MELSPGTPVDLEALGSARVRRKLGEGGQGFVYEVMRPAGQSLALKWYKPISATAEQHRSLRYLVDHGSPDRRFLWPLALAHTAGHPGFGYAMRLRDERYIDLTYLVTGTGPRGETIDPSFATVITVCRHLTECFLRLHARGMCYRDINFHNVFFHPRSGDILVCDNDNIGIDDGQGGIRGTPFFMAPQLVRDVSFKTAPSTQTDLHSLAVLLFYLLCMDHPLTGAKTDAGLRGQDWLIEHFGRNPVFVFDPDDDSNRPLSARTLAYWQTYPRFVRDLFVQAFTEGLHEPSARVRETEWVKALQRLRDASMPCVSCGQTSFWDEAEPNRPCVRCGSPLPTPLVLQVGRHRIVLSSLTRLWSDHIDPNAEQPRLLGRVRPHPHDAGRWGLQNLSELTWQVRLPDGQTDPLAPGKAVEIIPGLELEVGTASAVVLA